MKKFTLFAVGLLILNSVTSYSQQIPNNSFENWSVMSFFENPAGYNTTNFQSYLMFGAPNVTRTTDAHSGSFAAKLVTMGNAPDLIPGGIFLGQPGQGGLLGGIPYDQRPDSVRFYAKYTINPGDTAMFVLMFQKMSIPIGFVFINLSGTQSTYTGISTEVGWLDSLLMPDTVAFIVFSSNPGLVSTSGSTLYVDDIEMLGATQQLPNNGFENWLDISAENPDNWATSNPYTIMGSGVSVNKSTDHIDGLYSVMLTNAIGPQGDTTSFITNGFIGGNGPDGGTPISQNPSKFTFYYKYQPVGLDSALAMTLLWRWDPLSSTSIAVDSALIKLEPQATWTYFEMPFSFNGSPHADTVTVAFSAGQIDQFGGGIGLGSTLWVDNVHLEYGPIGINTIDNHDYNVFPNPAGNEINLNGSPGRAVQIEILSPDGKLLKSMKIIPGTSTDIADLLPGYYLYRITGTSVVTGKFIKIN